MCVIHDLALTFPPAPSRTNRFFDKMNEEFFQPRGLFCMLLTYNPELPDAPSTMVDLNSLVSRAVDANNSGLVSRVRNKLKSSHGKTYGDPFAEVAPLVFPDLDQLASDKDAGKKLSALKKRKGFVDNYFDRRAQAKFVSHPSPSR